MVAPGDDRRPGRRAKRRRMELRVAQAVLRNAIERWGGNHATEGARHAVAGIVGHDQQDIGCPLGGTIWGGGAQSQKDWLTKLVVAGHTDWNLPAWYLCLLSGRQDWRK